MFKAEVRFKVVEKNWKRLNLVQLGTIQKINNNIKQTIQNKNKMGELQ